MVGEPKFHAAFPSLRIGDIVSIHVMVGEAISGAWVCQRLHRVTIAAAMDLTDAQERALVRGMMPRAKVEWLQGFSKRFWNAEYQARFKVLATAAIEVAEFRNNIAHGLIVHNQAGEWHTISFRGQHRFGGDVQKLTPQEVGRHVQMAMETGFALHQFSVDVTEGKAKATSPPAPPADAR